MANHRQAEKRNRQRIRIQTRCRHYRTRMRTFIKRVRVAIDEQDVSAAQEALAAALPVIDRCGQKRVIPPLRASRLVSRLTRAVQKLGLSVEKAGSTS